MPAALSQENIRRVLEDDCAIDLLQEVDSTNTWLLRKAKSGATLPLACFAEHQTGGRGRRGREWISSPGAGITMSLAWHFDIPLSELGVLSLATGMAVARALEESGLADIQLKWPNDVLADGRKIAGILIETATISENAVTVVAGVGLNYDLANSPGVKPDQPWTDVVTQLASERPVDRSTLAGRLLRHCIRACRNYPLHRKQVIAEYSKNYDACAGKAVSVIKADGECLQGIADGVNDNGELRVSVDGELKTFSSADISLRSTGRGMTGQC